MAADKEFPSDKADKFVVRFPDGMRDQIAEAAKANGRSMNSEIIHRLQLSLAADRIEIDDAPPTSQADRIQVMLDRITELAEKILQNQAKEKEK